MAGRLEKFKKLLEDTLTERISGVSVGGDREISFKSLDMKVPDMDLEAELKAKLGGSTYGVPVKAEFELIDKETGEKQKSSVRIFKMPIRTNRGSFIWNGNEIYIKNQYRRRPGVYTKYNAAKGGRYENEFNMAKGRSFFDQKVGMYIEPESGNLFFTNKNSKFNMYPLMKAFGVSDGDIRESMGPKLFSENFIESPGKEIIAIAKSITGKKYSTPADASEAIKEKFENVSFDGGVNETTLGKDHTNITPEFWVDSVKKLVRVAGGIQKPDDVDAAYFREYLEPYDNIIRAIEKSAEQFTRTMGQRRGKRDLSKILANANFDKNLSELFKRGSLKDQKNQQNPIDWVSGTDALTVYGPGGIQQSRSVTDAMRLLQPSLFGIADPIFTPEDSDKIGVVLHRAMASRFKSGNPYIAVKDKDGKSKNLPAAEFFDSVIGIGNPKSSGSISAIHRGSAISTQASKAKYFIEPEGLFSYTTNMVPMIGSTYGMRVGVGAKQLGQALPLKDRESPLVESTFSKSKRDQFSAGYDMDEQGNNRAVKGGTVTRVSKSKIYVSNDDGTSTVYSYPVNFPLNKESYINNTPTVKAGDKVKTGDVLAGSIFSKDGKLAIGTNLKTAFLAFKGHNFEDGFVISDTAAKKLTSLHMHKYEIEKTETRTLGKSNYAAMFSSQIVNINMSKYSDNGIIREGEEVELGDPLILAYEQRELTPQQAAIAGFSKRMRNLLNPKDIKIVYDNEFKGKVVRVYEDSKAVKVFVETEEPAVEGDKIATRYGGKGIITKIIPDELMPRDESGDSMDVLFNPHGIPTRMNPSQIIESTLGKIAAKKGKTYQLDPFTDFDNVKFAKSELEKAKMSDEEMVIDPETGKKMDRVHVGKMYFMKLGHSVRSKMKAGDIGVYDVHYDQPKKIDSHSTRAIDGLSLYSLLASGARHNLYDMSSIKSQRNDEYWRALQTGQPIPSPNENITTTKTFMENIKALGLMIDRKGDMLSILPATDDDILKRSYGEIKEARFLRSRDMKPEPGGFYDPKITGGIKGERWTHIELARPIPNPMFDRSIPILLGITKNKYEDIVSGSTKVNKEGKIDEEGTLSGGEAISAMLDAMSLDDELEYERDRAKSISERASELRAEGEYDKLSTKWGDLDSSNRRIRILRNVKEIGKKPSSLFVISKFPILPPRFRQMTEMGDGTIQNPPINELYQAVKLESDAIKKMDEIGFDDEEFMADRVNSLYKHVGAAIGIMDPVSFQLRHRAFGGGILRKLSPKKGVKEGFIQGRMLKKPQDLSGGTTITVDPNLSMDEIGVPEQMAWTVYKPFIMRKLAQIGYTPMTAIKAIEDRTDIAKLKLDEVMKERPLLVNRHPSLHKFNFMSQRAHIVPGQAIKLNPLVTSGFNADFDGDSMIGDIWIAVKPDEALFGSGGVSTRTKVYASCDIKDVPHSSMKESKLNKTIYKVPDGVFVPSISEEGEVTMNKVTEFHKHKNCEEWKITLSDHTELLVSGDHSLACLCPESGRIEKYAPSAALNMPVPRIFKYRMKGKFSLPGIPNSTNRLDIISDIGFFVGSIRSNKNGRGVSFKKNKFMEPRISKMSRYTDASAGNGPVRCPQITEWIAEYVMEDSTPRIPSFMLGVGDDERAAFVAGFIESVINPTRPGLVYRCSRFDGMLKDMANLMQSVGVGATVLGREINNTNELVELDISQPDFKDFYLLYAEMFTLECRSYINGSRLINSNRRVRDCVPIPTEYAFAISEMVKEKKGSSWTKDKLRSVYQSLPYSRWLELGYEMWPRNAAKSLIGALSDGERSYIPDHIKSLVDDLSVRWSMITKTQKTGRRLTMYDITVENNPNFATVGGHIVWDTMNIHVPTSDGAVVEASKELLPRNFLFGPDRNIIPMPSNEALLGLYTLSKKTKKKTAKKYNSVEEAENSFLANEISVGDEVTIGGKSTTLGREIILGVVPQEYHGIVDGKIIDKALVQELVKAIYKDDPNVAADTLNNFKDVGNKYAYLTGFSVSLNDIDVPKEMYKSRDSMFSLYGKDPSNSDVLTERMKTLQGKFSGYLDNNRLFDMQRSGAKGKWGQVSQILLAPGFMEGPGGSVGSKPVSSGYAEGMSAHDYLNTLFAARSGDIAKASGTAKGGELAKNEVHTAIEVVISGEDCGTTNGIDMDRSDPYVIGRYEAGTNKFIDERFISSVRKKKYTVRSPLTCEMDRGICAMCYGTNDQGRHPRIGDHVGIDAAQSLSERITQGLLRSFHSGTGRGVSGTAPLDKQVSDLFGKMPKHFEFRAPIALEDGKVTGVDKSPGGGWDIRVGDRKYHAGDRLTPSVKKGDKINRGDQLSSGYKHPRDVANLEGLLGVRKYLSNAMRDIYTDKGISMNPTHFEVISRALTEHGRITDPGTSEYETGDMETVGTIDSLNKASDYGIKYAPVLSGADRVPMLRKDFLAQMGRRNIIEAVQSSASEGRKANIHTINPINSWMFGEFRSKIGPGGEY